MQSINDDMGRQRLAARFELGPVFELDPRRVSTQLARFRDVFPDVEVLYALKANSHCAVLDTLIGSDCGFEAASWNEIALLLDRGVRAESILFGTAVKHPVEVEKAFVAGVRRFAADSAHELTMLSESAPGSGVLLRARVDDSASVFQMSQKFGADVPELACLIDEMCRHDLRLDGLSFNVGSQCGREDAWANALNRLRPLAEKLSGLGPVTLDLGGGFPAQYDRSVPGIEEIASATFRALRGWPSVQLCAEPGRFLVASSMTLFTSVVARIERAGQTWLYLDAGVYNALFEAMSCQGSTPYPVRALREAERSSADQQFVLAGPTGDGLDVISHAARLPADTRPGDRLQFEHVGAYTLAMASRFNGIDVPPVRIVNDVLAGAMPVVA